MKIAIHAFNDSINSKTGAPLPPGQKRGTPEWREFELLLISALKSLSHDVVEIPEHPFFDPPIEADRHIYVHQTKRDKTAGNLFYMQMHLRDLFTLDTNGWGADHSAMPADNAFTSLEASYSRRYCQELADEWLATGQSKCEQPVETGETPSKFILVPIQIPRDYTIKHHSPITVKYFIDSIQAWGVETRNHIVFKMHPFNNGDADLHQSVDDAVSGSRYIHKVEGNIHELIHRSMGVWVINSGTGFESLVHGKPVCTFGNCDYRAVTFNADLRRLDEARNFLSSYTDRERNMAYQYVEWYVKFHAYKLSESDTKERLTRYLQGVL